MASRFNDQLNERTVEGSLNYYDKHRCKGTAANKGLASRLGGHSYNILSNQHNDEIYFRELRHQEHFVDKHNRHTEHMLGKRRRKFACDERNLVGDCIKMPIEHPRDEVINQHRTEIQLAQMENTSSWADFQDRTKGHLFPPSPPKRYAINNRLYANEVGKLRPERITKTDWLSRRGEPMRQSISCPSLELADPQGSLDRAVRADARKEATQRQTESAHFAPWHSASTYANSMDHMPAGRQMAATQPFCSVSRVENHDFAVSRKNNHFSSQDKLTRADPYFMRPRLGITNNSVKYDIVSNERRWFKY